MKTKVLFAAAIFLISWFVYSGFSGQDDNPKWNQHPSTRLNLSPVGDYVELPQMDLYIPPSSEPRYITTPQGVFAVGPNFRVHPRAVGTQSEVPITRHPLNPKIMFASANTFQGGGFSTGVYRTLDGGVTWSGNDTLGGTILNSGDPGPVIDYTGRWIISYLTSNIGASYSLNNGSTFSATFTFPGSTANADKNFTATDDDATSAYYGRSYTVYTEFGGAYINRIVVSYTANQGVSWTAIAPVSPPPSAGHHHQGCDLRISPFGVVRVVWANCTTNGQNSTEDSLGYAESFDGGVTWVMASNHAVNMNGIRTSDLLTPSNVAIRANGFPRIDIDRTCGPFEGDIYVVTGEKNFAPALDNADIVLMKSPDQGASWTRTRVNQNASGSYEYFPAVRVDESGGICVCYYSTRNTPTNDSAEIYLSRSIDGGITFTDVKISDHKFKPKPISGTAGGYQGDYIGITSGGNGKILPYWCEDITGNYQAWTALVDITSTAPCEDFVCTNFTGLPTEDVYIDWTGTLRWSRQTPTAYGVGGAGAARFNSWTAASGTVQSLTSYQFGSVGLNTYLTFDNAYGPSSIGVGLEDSLIVESSANGGSTWFVRARLWGSLAGGPLNTALPGGQFTPSTRQWAPKIFSLPIFTNKIRLRAVSDSGNDIWVDNVCVQVLAAPVENAIGIAIEGMFNCSTPYHTCGESVEVFLHRADFPNIKVDSAIGTISAGSTWTGTFTRALTGTFYKVMNQRNTIRTWSDGGIAYVRGASTHYNFILPSGQAFGNNQKRVCLPNDWWAMFSGDVNKDGAIDGTDVAAIDNDAFNFVSGDVVTDLNCDDFVDGSDFAFADNNAFEGVVEEAPPGAEPDEAPTTIEPQTKFESEAERTKYEETVKSMETMKENVTKNNSEQLRREELLKAWKTKKANNELQNVSKGNSDKSSKTTQNDKSNLNTPTGRPGE